MLRTILTVTFTLGVIGAGHAADSASSAVGLQSASCRSARAIVEDRQRGVVDGAFHFVDGDNMVCFRGPQSRRIVLNAPLDTAPSGQITRPSAPPLPQPNIVTRQPLQPPPAPWAPGPNVAGDGFPVRGTLAFKTGHTIPLTKTAEVGTRVGGYLVNDRVSFNSVEFRLGQRF